MSWRISRWSKLIWLFKMLPAHLYLLSVREPPCRRPSACWCLARAVDDQSSELAYNSRLGRRCSSQEPLNSRCQRGCFLLGFAGWVGWVCRNFTVFFMCCHKQNFCLLDGKCCDIGEFYLLISWKLAHWATSCYWLVDRCEHSQEFLF